MGLELAVEVVHLEDGQHFLALLSDCARLEQRHVERIAEVHGTRPRAAALRISADAAERSPKEALGVISVALQAARV